MTWEEVLRANGHSEVHILKVDIEGEQCGQLRTWVLLPSWLALSAVRTYQARSATCTT